MLSNAFIALQQLGDANKLQGFKHDFPEQAIVLAPFDCPPFDCPPFDCHSDPTEIPEDFDIEMATLRMNYLSTQMTEIWEKYGSFAKMADLMDEALFLQIRTLHYWLPHPLSGADYPFGQATSSIMVNYLYYLLESNQEEQAFEFIQKHVADKTIYTAQLKRSYTAQKILSVAIQIACRTQNSTHRQFAMDLMDWMPQYIPKDGWSFVHLAAVHLWKDDWDKAFEAIRKALSLSPEATLDIEDYIEEQDCYRSLKEHPKFGTLFEP